MSDQTKNQRDADGRVDAYATVAIMTIVIVGMYLWLSGMPS